MQLKDIAVNPPQQNSQVQTIHSGHSREAVTVFQSLPLIACLSSRISSLASHCLGFRSFILCICSIISFCSCTRNPHERVLCRSVQFIVRVCSDCSAPNGNVWFLNHLRRRRLSASICSFLSVLVGIRLRVADHVHDCVV